MQLSDTTSIIPFLMIKTFSSQAKHRLHKPSAKKDLIFWKMSNSVKWRGKNVYWGVLFYSGQKIWLAIINILLTNIFSLLSCSHRLPYFASLTFDLILHLYGFALFCSWPRLLRKLCVCPFLVSNPVLSGACSQFNFCISYCLFLYKKQFTN